MIKTRTIQKIAAIIVTTILSAQIPASARTDSSFFLLPQNPVTRTNVSMQSLVAGQTAFALDLYGQLKTNQGNLFFSPYSISTCLGIVYAGARGETAHEMARTFHFSAVPTNLPIPMSELEKDLNEVRQEKGIELDTANGLWAQDDYKFLPSYLDLVKKYFNGAIKQVNFRTNAEPVRKEINAWVDDKTRDKITDLLGPGTVDTNTRMVLVNAIYFNGTWSHQFDKQKTTNAPFTIASGKKVQAPLMHNESSWLNYAQVGHVQLLELSYKSGDPQNPGRPISMIVLLPKDVKGLKKLESTLNANTLSNWLAQARGQKVNVFLPKFKMTEKFRLRQTLVAMGMEESFSALADFSRMDGRRDLQISDVIHKAYVDVNEEGTEAAAATATVMFGAVVSKPKPLPVFRADHPFIFLIRDNLTGCILFLGRVNDPTAS